MGEIGRILMQPMQAGSPPASLPAAAQAGETFWILGSFNTIKVREASYTLLESAAPPGGGGGGMLPHAHHAQEEAVYVLQGEYALVVGGGELRLGPGSFASVPRGTVHASRVTGSEPGRCLVILTPPGPTERFFEEVGVPVADWAPLAPPRDLPDMERFLASARRHGIELLTTQV
ncbi:hypothetical protein BH20ACT11_BH20ACT11_04800 [soil metagenome]